MSFKVELKGIKALKKKLQNLDTGAASIIRDEMRIFGLNTVNDAKRLAPVDEGFLRNSITFTEGKEGKNFKVEIIVAADYAAYIEFGTRKFAAAYVATLPSDWQTFAAKFRGPGGGSYDEFLKRIMEWVKRKGFAAELTKSGGRSKSKSSIAAQESAAYLIARSIIRKGIKPHPFLRPAVEQNKKILIKNLKDSL